MQIYYYSIPGISIQSLPLSPQLTFAVTRIRDESSKWNIVLLC